MTRPTASSGVAMKIFVKRNQVAPMRIVVEQFAPAKQRSLAAFVAEEDARQAPRYFSGNLHEVHLHPRTSRTVNQKVVSEVMVILFQCVQDEKVHRHPDRPAPIRVSAIQIRNRLSRLVV